MSDSNEPAQGRIPPSATAARLPNHAHADLIHRPVLASPDCMTYPCSQDCCSHGADVWPAERDALLGAGHATAEQFTGPEPDDEGDLLYRTAVGPRGCVFLRPEGPIQSIAVRSPGPSPPHLVCAAFHARGTMFGSTQLAPLPRARASSARRPRSPR